MAFHITSLYVGAFAIIAVVLAVNVIRNRVRAEVSLLDGGDAKLTETMRAFGNFTEYVPLGLFVVLMIENSGAAVWAVHLAGGALLVGRVSHALGLKIDRATAPRLVGMMLTFAVFIGGGGWLIYSFLAG